MNKESLYRLSDLAIELEALVNLALNKEDAPQRIEQLIKEKQLAISEIEISRQKNEFKVQEIETAVPNDDSEIIEKEKTDSDEIKSENNEEEVLPFNYEDSDNEDSDEGISTTDIPDDYDNIETYDEEVSYEDENDDDYDDIYEYSLENEDEKPRGHLVFSINDKFRFKRELFDNSEGDFNTTLSFVASMDNYAEAEEYFIEERGWDPAQPAVSEFMEIIKKYFK